MVGLGAKGNTRDEIFRGLRFTENSEEAIAKSYHSVINGFQVFISHYSILFY
ncbi:Alpha-1-antiproteinase [Orchesella cincta]|uniref:Alpha-1-antiproteinase n=1 Tax=Orchesella cincta TaxID=48709 RepID=A0A1D2MC94_ORCCI|nr:Alpha-1-antiproteinase [Orchesella cincta]